MEIFHRFCIFAVSLFGSPKGKCNDVRTLKPFHRFSIVGCWLVSFESGSVDDELTMKDGHRFFIGVNFGVLLGFKLKFLYIFGVLNQGGKEPNVNPRQGLWSVDDWGFFLSLLKVIVERWEM